MENNQLEQNLIKERFQQRKEALQKENISQPDKEILDELIKERINKGLESSPSSLQDKASLNNLSSLKVSTAPTVPQPEEDAYVQQELEQLVDIAVHKNIIEAVQTARKFGNAYLLDRLHDTLVDAYYKILKEKGDI